MPQLTKVTIYTDGACSGNPGPGGWGAILMAAGKSREISGGEPHTTNNRMELTAVIKSLALLTRPCEVELYSDSAYVVNAFNQNWIEGWQRKGWVNSAKDPVANKDLWEQLLELCKVHKVSFVKVKGHADNEFNNRCDELAVKEAAKFSK
ncbi:MAG: ribonuclease HI [Saccharofermentans sp.]|nr:ribonuclease HI [Saccharofermentans sp.]